MPSARVFSKMVCFFLALILFTYQILKFSVRYLTQSQGFQHYFFISFIAVSTISFPLVRSF